MLLHITPYISIESCIWHYLVNEEFSPNKYVPSYFFKMPLPTLAKSYGLSTGIPPRALPISPMIGFLML